MVDRMTGPARQPAMTSRALWCRACACFHGASALHHACCAGATLLVALAAGVAWLWIAGVPSRVTHTVLAELAGDRYVVTTDRMWLDPIAGLKARNVRIAPKDAAAAGPVSAAELLLDIDWLDLCAREPWLDAVVLRGGTAVLRLPPEFGTNGLPCDFVVSNMNLRIACAWDVFRLEAFAAAWPGGVVEGRGVVVPAQAARMPREPAPQGPSRGSPLDAVMNAQTALQSSPPWARELYRHLASVQPREPIRVDFDFDRHGAAPELDSVRLRVDGGAAVCRGLSVDGWRIEADVEQGVLRIPRIDLRAGGRSCRLDGRFVMTNRLIELHAINELPPSYWRELLPPAWLADLAHQPLAFSGPLRTEIWLPPAPLKEFGNRWQGVMTWSAARYREIDFRDGRMEISRAGRDFAVSNFAATAARAGRSGPLAGELRIDLSTGELDGRLQAALDPHLFDSWLPLATRRFVALFDFPHEPPAFDGGFRTGGESNRMLMVFGALNTSNHVFRGVEVASVETVFAYSNDFITLEPFELVRTNGTASGRLALDLANDVYAFDLRSTTDPLAIGALVSSNLLRSLRVGHYDGPAAIHAAGVYDQHHPANTDIAVDVDAERIGLRWFTADRATFTLRNRGLHYEATNIVATAFGGSVEGRFFHYPAAGTNGGHRFELDLDTRSNDLRQVALALHPDAKDPPTGTMKLKLQLAGLVEDDGLTSYKGEGSVDVNDGQLHKIRLFGGLSTLLAKLSPDLGYAAQSGMRMSFDIRDGKLATSDIELSGFWMSVKGKGAYGLQDKNLDFLAEVQLLKKGTVVGEAVRLLTTPVTKLFQIKLTGTLDEPEWQTANLPRIF